MRKNHIDMLLAITKQTGLNNEATLTTSELADMLGLSQQSVSRKLRELEQDGYIERHPSVDGIRLRLREKAVSELKDYLNDLKSIFSQPSGRQNEKALKGKVITGLGEGQFYTEVDGYKRQFIDKLGLRPFPGTLNLRVSKQDKERFLEDRNAEIVQGFKTKDRTYGFIKGYQVKAEDIKAALIVPERTHHSSDTVELISPRNLRKELDLKDGDEVIIR